MTTQNSSAPSAKTTQTIGYPSQTNDGYPQEMQPFETSIFLILFFGFGVCVGFLFGLTRQWR